MILNDLFWAKVDRTGGCWLWIGFTNKGGYGVFHIKRHPRLAHRLAYEALVGPIPQGLDLDHLCRVRRCVNPAHLEPVTRRENLLRGDTFIARQVARTHCPQGHPYDAVNTRNRRGKRECRTCHRERKRQRAIA